MMEWISSKERLPDDETPVLILVANNIRIGELRWEIPGYEDNYESYRYWDDPKDAGQFWEGLDVTHWMPLPDPPTEPTDVL
jgi:hypothetical protein